MDTDKIRYIKRVTVGSEDLESPADESAAEGAIALLNQCLSRSGGGAIVAVEKNFSVVKAGEQEGVQQSITYHVGFIRKPFWIEEA